MAAALRIGTAGWSYPDWRGVVYPRNVPDGFDALRYLAAYVDVIEINSTFYRPPEPRIAERWAETVSGLPGFRFTAKLYQGFTHAPPAEWSEAEVRQFQDGLCPLAEAGLLGAVLAQFPFFFANTPENLAHLQRIAATFDLAPLVVEVRHRSFTSRAALDAFASLGLSFCNVDQPLARTSIEPGARVTGPVGYFRLHGRNREAWFAKGATRDEKYDYLYSEEEIARFVPLVRALLDKAPETYVVANNHFLGKAPANALELKHLLSGEPVEVPPALIEAYPRLRSLAGEGP
ncbi:MAG: DUF72 domain-containing protein [Planctomycetes bacterium]|nr:DUF72 domain-containing protein [Planctomycetota bacterium]